MGRYSRDLARALIAATGVHAGQRALDVGCGPGALTGELVAILGTGNVVAADPSESFAEACRTRYPGVRVEVAFAESMPFADDSADVAIAQLVVHFMADAHAGVGEMKRITRSGGITAAATWDYASGMTMLRRFWDAANAVDPAGASHDESQRPYTSRETLGTLWSEAGMADVNVEPVDVKASYANFEDLWTPLESGVGPAGTHLVALDPDKRAALKAEYRRLLAVSDEPFELAARAWAVTGRVP